MAKRVYVTKAAEILASAEELFLRDGYASTSMNNVAIHAEVAKQTLYANFPTKKELFAAVIGRRSANHPEVPSDLDLDAADLRIALVEVGVAFLAQIYSPGQVELFQTVVAESRQFPELGELMIRGPFAETPRMIATFLRDRALRGELRLTDVDEGTAMFTSLLKADAHSRLIFSQHVDTSTSALRAFAARAVDLFLDGAATAP